MTILYQDAFPNGGANVDIDSWDTVANGGVWWNDATDSTPWTILDGSTGIVHSTGGGVWIPGTGNNLAEFPEADLDIAFDFNYGNGTSGSYDTTFWIRSNSGLTQALGIKHDASAATFSLVNQAGTDQGETPVASGMGTHSTVYAIRILLSGNKISVWVDDVLRVDEWENSTGNTNKYFGFAGCQAAARIDNFLVTDVAETTFAISSNGHNLTFTLAGATAASITDIDGSGSVAVTSEGYNNGSLTTRSRTIPIERLLSSTDNSGDADIVLRLAEPIHDDCTSVTFTCDEAFVSDGSVDLAAQSATSVTNNSTRDYPVACCNIVSEPMQRRTSEFNVDVEALAGSYAGHRGELGIDRVDVTVTTALRLSSGIATADAAAEETITGGTSGATAQNVVALTQSIGSTTIAVKNVSGTFVAGESITFSGGATATVHASDPGAVAVTKSTQSHTAVTRLFSEGPFETTTLFRLAFDPEDDWSASVASTVTILAKAYPMVGDADSVRESNIEYAFLDPADSYDIHHCVVDTNGTEGTPAVYAGDGGYAAGTDSLHASARTNFYDDINAAAKALQTASSNGTPSFSVIYLAEGSHAITGYSAGVATGTSDGPLIVTRDPAVSKSACVLTGSDSGGYRSIGLQIEDVTHDFANATATDILVASLSSVLFGIQQGLGSSPMLYMKNVDQVGGGQEVVANDRSVSNNYIRTYKFGGSYRDTNGKPNYYDVARDVEVLRSSNDLWNPAANNCVFYNVLADDLIIANGSHVDTFQLISTGLENLITSYAWYKNLGEVQAPWFWNGTGVEEAQSIGARCIISEDDTNPTHMQWAEWAIDSLFFYHNSCFDAFSMVDDEGATAFTNCFVIRNLFKSLNLHGDAGDPDVSGMTWRNNHVFSTTNEVDDAEVGDDWTSGGGTFSQSFMSTEVNAVINAYASEDYSAKTSSAITSRWDDPLATYSATGSTFPSDGSGAIGALQVGETLLDPETMAISSTGVITSSGSNPTLVDAIVAILATATITSGGRAGSVPGEELDSVRRRNLLRRFSP
ncbi:hypothetical protein KOR42_39310 [Thalassoglobus neptunius]|uniref:Uncharacterized protein n=1 Tax=Thalassoglobus neptunius TaxID=1938619 RepID=A0A5C5WFY8_9PLAN|nr:hypothetical protein [Thalassoglobus neptunius]TWT49015.1 hypothetical protein KOR42_39310 [Thalassoglobus neptunius]